MKHLRRVCYWLILLSAVGTAVVMAWINRDLHRALASYQGMHLLSPDTCKLIAADLQSADAGRIGVWKAYFQRVAEGNRNMQDGDLPADEVLGIYFREYRSKEMPARSNRFARLVSAVMGKQDTEGLSTNDLITYIGQPDATSTVLGYRMLQYRYNLLGTNILVSMRASNGWVSTFEFQFEPTRR